MVSPALSTSEMSISNARPQRLSVLEQHALSGDQAERSEGEGFHIHRGIVLKGLPIHTDRGKSSQRDRKVSRRFEYVTLRGRLRRAIPFLLVRSGCGAQKGSRDLAVSWVSLGSIRRGNSVRGAFPRFGIQSRILSAHVSGCG